MIYKIGDKLKCKENLGANFIINEIYEIATQIQQDKKFVIFDCKGNAIYFDLVELDYCFEKVDNEDLKINKVKNPNAKHYEIWDNFETIDIIKNVLTKEEYIGFLKGNILKYQLRLGKKDGVDKEMIKIKDYQNELNSILQIREINE